jgi:hypothetical protein
MIVSWQTALVNLRDVKPILPQIFWSISTLNSDASIPRISFKTLPSTMKLLESFQSALSMSRFKCNIHWLSFTTFWVTQLGAEMVEIVTGATFPLAAREEVISAATFAPLEWREHQKIPSSLPKDELQFAQIMAPHMLPLALPLAIQWWLDLISPQWLQSIAHKKLSITHKNVLNTSNFQLPTALLLSISVSSTKTSEGNDGVQALIQWQNADPITADYVILRWYPWFY